MDILIHKDARWGPGDFDLPTEQPFQSFCESTPQFLEPTHQPQMRLPSFSSIWLPLPQVNQSASPAMVNSNGGYSNIDSSPTLPALASFHLPNPSIPPWTESDPKRVYNDDDHTPVPPPIQTMFRNQWEEPNHDDLWTNGGSNFPLAGTYINEHYTQYDHHASPGTSYINLQPSMSPSQGAEMNPRPASSQLMQSSQLTHELLPSPAVHDPIHKPMDLQNYGGFQAPLASASEHSPGADEAQESPEKEVQNDTKVGRCNSLGGPFIHALCGKGFATLSRVKKHHWGKRHNDLATTTGCWAKHKKPAVAWDDHPSCKDERSNSQTAKPIPLVSQQIEPQQIETKAAVPETKPSVAVDPSQHNIIPGFSTLNHLPHTVAETLNVGADGFALVSQEATTLYSTYQLPLRSNFDNLLTAVNVASKLDAPQPQGRNDSIILQLDAQAIAAEGSGHHAWSAAYVPPTSSFDPCSGRSNTPVVPDAIGPEPKDSLRHTMALSSTIHETKEDTPSAAPSDIDKPYAGAVPSRSSRPAQTQPSDSSRKRRKI